jgi:predicted nucleic acid-binding protein
MGFLIDTGVWIDLERGKLDLSELHRITGQELIYLSPVNVAEFRLGLELLNDRAKKNRALALLRRMRRKPQLRITNETAEVFATISAELIKLGRGLDFRVQDLWLAAQAVQRDLTLITGNPKDFTDIPGLKVVAL